MAGAVPTRYRKQVDEEKKLYFTPSYFTEFFGTKPETRDVRNLAEEGFYVEPPPYLSERNKNIMEQRLLKEFSQGHNEWFGEDGRIKRSSSGVATYASRRQEAEEAKKPLTLYVKASIGNQKVDLEDGIYQLDVDCSKMLFTHHPLFCKENMLATRLMESYGYWHDRKQENLAETLNYKLKAIREARKDAREFDDETDEFKKRDRLLIAQIEDTRQKRNSEELRQRRILEGILKTWQELKRLRRDQGYTVTSLQLYLKKHDSNEQKQMEWEDDLKYELEEAKAQHQHSYLEQLEIYSRQLAQFKKERKEKLRREREQQNGDDGDGEHSGVSTDEETDNLMMQSVSAPQRPPPFDEEIIWKNICANAVKFRGDPKEPVFEPVLASNAEITPLDRCPQNEQNRRNAVTKYKYRTKVFFNDTDVCQSAPRPLNADFCVNFSRIFNLHVVEWPRSIKLRVLETTDSTWSTLADIYLPIPGPADLVTPGTSCLEEYEFSSDVQVAALNTAVGSGFPVKLNEGQNSGIVPVTGGFLISSALWGRTKNGSSLAPPAKLFVDVERKTKIPSHNAAALREYKQLLETNKLDPNNPENMQILNILKEFQGETDQAQTNFECFRLEPPELELMSEAEFAADRRFKLLELRSQEVPEFKNMKMIPSLSREIPPDIFKNYQQRLVRDKEKTEMTDIDAYRAGVNKYLSQVREKVIQRLNTAKQTRSLQDVVHEEQLPSLGSLSFMLFPDPGRPLKPPRKERKKVAGQKMIGTKVNIIASVVRAFNVPVRQTKFVYCSKFLDLIYRAVCSPRCQSYINLVMQAFVD